ncbi:transposable element Tcb1 transposase [Trichonephila clavipes]|nr:transposable element Tcb1 transposase [Trichonephila clavipes]
MPGCRQWRPFQQTDDLTRGAARVTSAREDRCIRRQAVAAPQATSTSILQHVQDTREVPISSRTISRLLVDSGLHSRRPLRILELTPQRRRARSEWCRNRAAWMAEWKNGGTACSQMSPASVFSMIVSAYECGVTDEKGLIRM